MQLWNQRRLPELASDGATGRCCSLDDVYDARRVAEQLGIPYYVVNFEQPVREAGGRAVCVASIWRGARRFPARFATTSSSSTSFWTWRMVWARSRLQPATTRASRATEIAGRYQLRRAVDAGKDQTYFLFGLTQRQLARTLFPLGEMNKTEVRALARQMGLAVAEKDESYEICFVPERRLRRVSWMRICARRVVEPRRRSAARSCPLMAALSASIPACIISPWGSGAGLGIATGEPLYVIATDAATQRVTVGPNDAVVARRPDREPRQLDLVGRPCGAGARAGEDPQQARGRRGDALSDSRARPRGSAFR